MAAQSRWIVGGLLMAVLVSCAGAAPSPIRTVAPGLASGQAKQLPLHCGPTREVCRGSDRSLPVCLEGHCARACRVGYGECDGDLATECEAETLVDPCHCGGCATRCSEGQFCVAGLCSPRQDPIVRRGPPAPATCR